MIKVGMGTMLSFSLLLVFLNSIRAQNGDNLTTEAQRYIATKKLIAELTDENRLVKFALEDQDSDIRRTAVDKLTNQDLLGKVAIESRNRDIRITAVNKLTNQTILRKVVFETKGPGNGLQHLAFSKLTGTNLNVDYRILAGDLKRHTDDSLEAIGRIHLAILNPIISSRMSNIRLEAIIEPLFVNYDNGPKQGEHVTFTLRHGDQLLVTQEWTTEFDRLEYNLDFKSPGVYVSGMMAKFFRTLGLSQEDLTKLNQSEVIEIRAGAVANLNNQPLLAKIARGEDNWQLRIQAIKSLSDQSLLMEIAGRNYEYDDVLIAAVETLSDQQSLAKVAQQTSRAAVCEAALDRIKDQKLLAELVFDSFHSTLGRYQAMERVTNEVLLVNIANDGPTEDLRNVAKKRLEKLRSEKP